MIARLTGRIIERAPGHLIVDVGGVGYRVGIPLSTFEALPHGEGPITLRVHTHVREESLALYGFVTLEEQELFEQLIAISGIGPKLALAILSGLPLPALRQAILDGDAPRLRRIPGVGTRTADRVILEMKDQLAKRRPAEVGAAPSAAPSGLRRDAVMALLNLGYRDAQAEEAVRVAMDGLPGAGGPPGADGGGPASRPAAGKGSPAVEPPPDLLPELLRRSLRYLAS